MKTLIIQFTGAHYEIHVKTESGTTKMPGKYNHFKNKTDAENTIRNMVKNDKNLKYD